jgi:hypothetical protein
VVKKDGQELPDEEK